MVVYCTLLALPLSHVAAEDALWLPIQDSSATVESEMKPYDEVVEHTRATIHMVPIPGGSFVMGSPEDEVDRKDDEGPQHEGKIQPFWMAECEINWDAYDVWMFDLDIHRRRFSNTKANQRDQAAEEYQLSQPTAPYMNMDFGMGKKNCPAICMTQLAARTFCQWLTAKTGRYYRLPTEAEWEYACRAGTTTAYYFGDDVDQLEDYAWFFDNSDDKYQKVKQKKPNQWGLYDMHGNVAEWVLDQYDPEFYGHSAGKPAEGLLAIPTKLYPRVVRGGSWYDDPDLLRSAARDSSTPEWKRQDPQVPKSIWYHTDALHVGFRIVRPLKRPLAAELQAKWDKHEPVQERKEGRK